MTKIVIIVLVLLGSLLLMAPADADMFSMRRVTVLARLSVEQLKVELKRAEKMRKKVEDYELAVARELAAR